MLLLVSGSNSSGGGGGGGGGGGSARAGPLALPLEDLKGAREALCGGCAAH
jgi:hypothetical protein